MSQQLFCKVGDREYGPISPSVLQNGFRVGDCHPPIWCGQRAANGIQPRESKGLPGRQSAHRRNPRLNRRRSRGRIPETAWRQPSQHWGTE